MTSRQPDRQAFEVACLPWMRALYGVALRLSRKPEDANDIVQETMLRAYRTFQSFQPGTNARAWLLKILHTVFLNRRRKESRSAGWLPLEDLKGGGPAAPVSSAGSPSALELESALRSLPESSRVVILLVDVEGLSYEEAGQALDVPVGTIRSRLHRARSLLLNLLRPRVAMDSKDGRGSA